MKKGNFNFVIEAKSVKDSELIQNLARCERGLFEYIHRESTYRFVSVVDDDYEPQSYEYETECGLDWLGDIVHELKKHGVHFEVTINGMVF